MNYQEKVKQFQIAGGEDLNAGLTPLRRELLREEIQELEDAIEFVDRVGVLDALCDILYVNYGTANLIGEKIRGNEFSDKECLGFLKSMNPSSVDEITEAVLFFVYRKGYRLSDFLKALDRVHESNMSKFCNTEKEAIDSVADYKEKGIETNYIKNGDKWVIKRSSDNKTLKSKYYSPVKLDDLI